MFGGQNGAKIRSDSVPIAKAACAPRYYKIAMITGVRRLLRTPEVLLSGK